MADNLQSARELLVSAQIAEQLRQALTVVLSLDYGLNLQETTQIIVQFSVYNLLHRHRWCKLVPEKRHPQSDPLAQEDLDSLVLPHVNTHCMQLFLNEVGQRHRHERIVMVLNVAHQRPIAPACQNMRLLSLPLYAPELNPVEHV